MKKTAVLLLVILFCLALPLFAQEKKEMAKEAAPSMTPPKALEDDLFTWMVGEWEGWDSSPMGKSQVWQKIEMDLDNQFVMIHYTGKTTEMTPEQMKMAAAAYGMPEDQAKSLIGTVYKGKGPMTINPQSGEIVAYWFDSMRGIYTGKGKRDGNKYSVNWEGPMGSSVMVVEKTSDDKMVMTFDQKDPAGNVMHSQADFTRKKMATTK
jgi:hypothetical protein